jgi:hypothetical protein
VGGAPLAGSATFGSNVGWFPLGPREVYVPAYRVSPAYAREVNVTNTNINVSYVNKVYQNTLTPTHYVNNRPTAVTAVSENVFVSGQRVGGHAAHLPPPVLANARVTPTAPAIAPIRQSVLGPSEAGTTARPPASLAHRPVVARTPPPRGPAPFDRQLQAMQTNGGHPLGRAEITQLQPATPAAPVRVVAPGGPVVNATSLAHGTPPARNAPLARGAGPSRAGTTPPPAAGEPGTNFAERARALQQSMFPPAPQARAPSPLPPAGSTYAPPVYAPPAAAPPAAAPPVYAPPTPRAESSSGRSDRPPSVQQPLPPSQQRSFSADDPTRGYGRPPQMPVYQMPVRPDSSPPVRESARMPEPPRAPVPQPQRAVPPPPLAPAPPMHVAPPPAQVPPPPRTPSPASEPRDSAPHGDRDSRERQPRL